MKTIHMYVPASCIPAFIFNRLDGALPCDYEVSKDRDRHGAVVVIKVMGDTAWGVEIKLHNLERLLIQYAYNLAPLYTEFERLEKQIADYYKYKDKYTTK